MRRSALLFGLVSLVGLGQSDPDANFKFDGCDPDQKNAIIAEFKAAIDMANTATTQVGDNNPYYQTFFPESVRQGPLAGGVGRQVYTRASSLLSDLNKFYGPFTVVCDKGQSDPCKAGYKAFMNQGQKRMTFCPGAFAKDWSTSTGERATVPSAYLIGQKTAEMDLRHASWSLAAVILHESMHTDYVMGNGANPKGAPFQDKSLDYAYGTQGCYRLAQGTQDRSDPKCFPPNLLKPGKILCPSPSDPSKEGVCPADKALVNADTWSIIAAGTWYSGKIGRQVLPAKDAGFTLPGGKTARSDHMLFGRATCRDPVNGLYD